jgi:Flp pilus assembly protein TadG
VHATSRRRIRRRGDQGQATVLVAAVLAVTVLATAGIARLGGAMVDASRAQAAADAAALAAVEGGADAAVRLADRNGARLVSVSRVGDDVVVVVEVDGASATARARALP